MSESYDPLLPTARDQLRFLLGDTLGTPEEPAPAWIADETYDSMLILYEDWRQAGIELALGLSSRFANEPDRISIDGELSVSWRDRIANWTRLIATWRAAIAADLALASELSSLAPTRAGWIRGEYTGHWIEE